MFPIDSFYMTLETVSGYDRATGLGGISYPTWLIINAVVMITIGILISDNKISDSPAYITGLTLTFLTAPIGEAIKGPIEAFTNLSTSDMTLSLLDWTKSPEAWLIFLAGFIVQTVAIGAWISSNLAMRPYDIFLKRISDKTPLSYNALWILFEGSFTLISLSLIYSLGLRETIGVGSIIVLTTGGFIVTFWTKLFVKIIDGEGFKTRKGNVVTEAMGETVKAIVVENHKQNKPFKPIHKKENKKPINKKE